MRVGLRPGTLLALGLFCGSLPALAAAQAQPAARPTAQDQQLARDLHAQLADFFVLPKKLELDPALREAANAIGAAHLARMRELLPQWVMEERTLQGATAQARPHEASYAAWARVLNELALWQIDTGDAAYEAATLAAIQASPGVCELVHERLTFDFASRIVRLQAMPPAERKAALATERSLLARWGKPRPTAAPWPAPPPQVAGMDLLAASRPDGGPDARLPLPPILASHLLGDGGNYAELAWDTRCHFQRWWLRSRIAAGAAPAQALAAFRYGTMITAAQRYGGDTEEEGAEGEEAGGAGSPAYPKFAARYGVTGTTTVTRSFDAGGKPLQAWVSGRNLTVPGIRGVRPVAFEDVFDALAVSYALAGSDAKGGKPGPKMFQMVWSLDRKAAAGSQAGKKQADKKSKGTP